MQAVIFHETLRFVQDHPVPRPEKGQARIRVNLAGICRTDLVTIQGALGCSSWHKVWGLSPLSTIFEDSHNLAFVII